MRINFIMHKNVVPLLVYLKKFAYPYTDLFVNLKNVVLFIQVELTGNSIYEYIHNYDQDEMNAILSLHPHMYQNPVSLK